MKTPQNSTDVRAPKRVSFYFSAHPDDWQLFMNPQAFFDVQSADTKVVFIHMTAGDVGLGTTNGRRKYPLYLARENGAEAAIRFMADANGLPPAEKENLTRSLHGHPIRCVTYRNTAAYFLRLPDGSPAGGGYSETGYQSLKRCAQGQESTLAAIDGTTSYQGWADLVMTLRLIVDIESGEDSIELHMPELDVTTNAGDHPDHYFTGEAALNAAAGLVARRVYHVGYKSAELRANLNGVERDMKAAVYAVTAASILELDHSVEWQHYDEAYAARTYVRLQEIEPGPTCFMSGSVSEAPAKMAAAKTVRTAGPSSATI